MAPRQGSLMVFAPRRPRVVSKTSAVLFAPYPPCLAGGAMAGRRAQAGIAVSSGNMAVVTVVFADSMNSVGVTRGGCNSGLPERAHCDAC